MAVSTVARVRTEFTGVAGTPAYSNFYFDSDSLTAGVYQTAVLDCWDAAKGAILDGVVATMINPIPIIDVSTGNVVDVAVGDGGSVTCTASADQLPPATSGLLQLHTGVYVAGREVRGRCFFPYPVETLSTDGKPISAYQETLTTFAELLQDPTHANGAWVIYSRAHARAEYITSWAAWGQWASLRSRRD